MLEAQVVALADSVAYDNHDLQDGLEAGILTRDALQDVDLWCEAEGAVLHRHSEIGEELTQKRVVASLIDMFVSDAIESSGESIAGSGVASALDATRQEGALVCFSTALNSRQAALQQFLFDSLYMDYRVVRVTKTPTSCAQTKTVYSTGMDTTVQSILMVP